MLHYILRYAQSFRGFQTCTVFGAFQFRARKAQPRRLSNRAEQNLQDLEKRPSPALHTSFGALEPGGREPFEAMKGFIAGFSISNKPISCLERMLSSLLSAGNVFQQAKIV